MGDKGEQTARPEFGSVAAIWSIALAITVIESAVLLLFFSKDVASSVSDPDDAMRLVQVRDLLHGKGWFDQLTLRVNPPSGLYMHWSRLVDGAEAALIWIFQFFMSAPAAELAARDIWPLLLILPATAAALFYARNLGGRFSVVISAALLTIDILIFRQFRPGRLDHHNIQITLAIVAVAIATLPKLSPRMAAFGGVITGLGLAVGLEGLPIHVIVGVSYAARILMHRDRQATISYGASLAISTAAFFLIQTPPSRLLLPFCDSLAINMVAAVLILGGGLAAIATLANRETRAPLIPLILLAALGLGVYLSIHPTCVRGVYADIDPRLQAIWFDNMSELLPLTRSFFYDPAIASRSIIMIVELAIAVFILWRQYGWSVPVIVTLLSSAAVIPLAIRYLRSEDYLFWVGVPAFAAAMSVALPKIGQSRVFIVLGSIAIAPASLAMLLMAFQPKSASQSNLLTVTNSCAASSSYEGLARLKPGVVMADVYLGPEILDYTAHSVLTAPYHRLSTQIVRVYDAQRAQGVDAENAARRMGANYIVDCTASQDVGSGLYHELRGGAEVSWLTRLSQPTDAIQIWRVEGSKAAPRLP